jgi:hypothetical protein
MGKAQDVSFSSVGEFLAYLPYEEFTIVDRLRELIYECIPDVQERLAYNVPFFYRHSRIVFIWPGWVPWGRKRKSGVELGFCRGNLLSDAAYLNKGSRKEVYIRTFQHEKEIDIAEIRRLLLEAVSIDREMNQIRKGKKKSG